MLETSSLGFPFFFIFFLSIVEIHKSRWYKRLFAFLDDSRVMRCLSIHMHYINVKCFHVSSQTTLITSPIHYYTSNMGSFLWGRTKCPPCTLSIFSSKSFTCASWNGFGRLCWLKGPCICTVRCQVPFFDYTSKVIKVHHCFWHLKEIEGWDLW